MPRLMKGSRNELTRNARTIFSRAHEVWRLRKGIKNMPHNSGSGHEREQEHRIKAVRAQLNWGERATRTGLFWLTIVAAMAFMAVGFCLVNL